MYLKKLSLINFKNFKDVNLSFADHVNCFVGDNGGGKTNLLDAIHYLSFCKSFINPIEGQNINHGEGFYMIQGTFELNKKEEKVYCGFKKGNKKTFKRNSKEYSRLADHIGLLPVVMVSPEDISLISEGSEIRRKLIDTIISQLDKIYLDNLIEYNKILLQRNALLKRLAGTVNFDVPSLEVWDEQMVRLGKLIHDKRLAFMEQFLPIFQEYFNFISGGAEKVSISYSSQLNDKDFSLILAEALDRDRIVQYSTVGIHKDDLLFKIEGFPIKKIGSQGQKKSFVIAIRLAQFDFIKNFKEFKPLLLLDDIFDKLDPSRVKKLIEKVSGEAFGQIFITHTHKKRLKEVLKNIAVGYMMFNVNNGLVLLDKKNPSLVK
ncbi:MAG TPA: DNA replication/repair protein RecF [Flavobacteriales bacterium]|nr:DNA replication/repair protein RecF [Flavobacteriales bacterium]